MTSKLHISDDLSLPRDAATSTIVVYGGKGMGKTNLASVLVEELAAANLQFSVIDPMGVWWGLRHAADGKGLGIKVLILGGLHGDLPITPESGALIADLVVDEDASVIIDISRRADGSMWAIAERIRFVRDYTKRLYQRQGESRRPLHQVIDEAARFAPQIVRQGESDVAACMGAIAVLVEEGRNVGIGVTLVTQRSARLNKDVAELADCMIAFRIVGPNSMRAVLDWLGEHVDKSRIKEISEKLRSLPRGSALVVSPGWLEFEGIVAMRMRATFDSSKTPEAGRSVRATGTGAKVDLAKYKERLSQLIEDQKASDPRALRARVAELEKQLAQKAPPSAPAGKTKVVEKRVFSEPEIKRFEKAVRVLHEMGTNLREQFSSAIEASSKLIDAHDKIAPLLSQIYSEIMIARNPPNGLKQYAASPPARPPLRGLVDMPANFATPLQSAPIVKSTASTNGEPVKIGGGERKILTVLAQNNPRGLRAVARALTKNQIALLTGYAHNGGGFNNYLASLRSRGLIEDVGGGISISTYGLSELGPFEAIPRNPAALFAYWMSHREIGKAERAILQSLHDRHPAEISKEAVAADAGYEPNGGGFNNALARLRTLQLIEGRGHLKLNNLLTDGLR